MSALQRDSVGYTVGFAALVCLVCAIPIAGAAVWLRPAQEENQRVDRLSKVLGVAGLIAPNEELAREEVLRRFSSRIKARVIELRTGRMSTVSMRPATINVRPRGIRLAAWWRRRTTHGCCDCRNTR